MKVALPVLYITEQCGIFNLVRNAVDVLERCGKHTKAKELCFRIVTCEDENLYKGIIEEYVNVIPLTD